MSTELDHAIRSALADIVATAPDSAHEPYDFFTDGTADAAPRRIVAVAASALVVLTGVVAVALVSRDDPVELEPAAPPASINSAAPVPATTPFGSDAPGTDPTDVCGEDGGKATVPNVAGMTYTDAVDALLAAGLSFESIRELAPDGTSGFDEQYAIVGQDVPPSQRVACGSAVGITAAYRPGTLHIVQPGDTYESIATAEDIPVDVLLELNGLTAAELGAANESATDPLDLGRAILLTSSPAPRRFVFDEQTDGITVTDIIDRDGTAGVVSVVLGGDRFSGVTLQFHIVPGQYSEPPTDFGPESIEVRSVTGVIVKPPDGSVSLLWQEDNELAIELAATPTDDSTVMPSTEDLLELAERLVEVDDAAWAAYRTELE